MVFVLKQFEPYGSLTLINRCICNINSINNNNITNNNNNLIYAVGIKSCNFTSRNFTRE